MSINAEYNFDIAVQTVMNYYGTTPMNKFFLASYLTGFPEGGNPYRVDRTERIGDRILQNADINTVEKRFWKPVFDCYGFNLARYKYVCGLMYDAVNHHAQPGNIKHQAINLLQGLQHDISFFNPTESHELNATLNNRCPKNDPNGQMHYVMQVVKNWLDDKKLPQDNRNAFAVAKKINENNGDSLPKTTVLRGLQSIIQTITLNSGTAVEPFGIQMMFKGERSFDYFKHIISLVSNNTFDKQYYEGAYGRALMLQYQQKGKTQAFWPILIRWNQWLFYLNFENAFVKYLTKNQAGYSVLADVSRTELDLPTNMINRSYAITEHDLIQLKRISAYVETWDSYREISRGDMNVKPMLVNPMAQSVKKNAGSS